jgi:hypothetical protein
VPSDPSVAQQSVPTMRHCLTITDSLYISSLCGSCFASTSEVRMVESMVLKRSFLGQLQWHDLPAEFH